MAKETVDLRDFLGTIPTHQLRQILQWAYYDGVHVKGFTSMRKADLIEEICQRLDKAEVFKGVIKYLDIRVAVGKYPKRVR